MPRKHFWLRPKTRALVEYLFGQCYRLTHQGWSTADPSVILAIVNRG